ITSSDLRIELLFLEFAELTTQQCVSGDEVLRTTPQLSSNNVPVLFLAASLFEFNIDNTRKEAGYPYLSYVCGEIFDVVAQKGEIWLAKNQDDTTNRLGWIWEQHFAILPALAAD
ncbi:hypothetical protein LTR16_007392, partial [Cryomyces antarcticus]